MSKIFTTALVVSGLLLFGIKPAIADAPTVEFIEIPTKKVATIPKVLERIAVCESGNRQFVNGEVLRGVVNPHDIGRFQINETIHLAQAKRLGMDIYTLKGNTDYALYLYAKNGTRDWSYSKFCWAS